MPGRVVFDKSGTRDPKPATTPKDCDTCQYTELSIAIPGFYDTVHDAGTVYSILRNGVLEDLWARLWKGFRCTDTGCQIPKACANSPEFLEAVAILGKAPDKNIRWQVIVTLGRKIQCVKTGNGKDVPPVFPDIEEPKPDSGDAERPLKPQK